MVGFARAVTDGTLRAYVEDMIVLPQLRGSGLGHRLLARLIEELGENIRVTLFCQPDLVPFYEGSGFRATRQVVMHRAPNS